MAKTISTSVHGVSRRLQLTAVAGPILLCFVVMLLQGSQAEIKKTFATPQEAIKAAVNAAEHNDTVALLQIFGTDGKDVVQTDNPNQDKKDREEFARLGHEKIQVQQDPSNPDRATFTVGSQESPFPVPLVRKNSRWEFDAATGRVEILAHRIGTNELNAVDICRGFVEAELEYAAADRDADGVLEYASKIVSSPGHKDGLYWDSDSLVPKSFAGAAMASDAAANGKTEPFHGYYFRILKGQGPDAAGGALDYVVNGNMIGGFAMIAWPAVYGTSGIQTFIVNHHGIVFGKDLGANTSTLAKQITRFNPDKSWHKMDE